MKWLKIAGFSLMLPIIFLGVTASHLLGKSDEFADHCMELLK